MSVRNVHVAFCWLTCLVCTAGIGKAIAREFLRSVGCNALSSVCLQLWRQDMYGSVDCLSRAAYASVYHNVSCLVLFASLHVCLSLAGHMHSI